MVNKTLPLFGVIAKRLFNDTFTRSNASDWGPDYSIQFISSGGTASVDGSVARLTAAKSADFGMDPSLRAEAGFVVFDFFVPANISDTRPYFAHMNGGAYPVVLEAYEASGSTWAVDLYDNTGDYPYFEFVPTPSTWYRVKGVWSGFTNGPTGVKVWKVSDPEPATYSDTGSHSFDPTDALTDPNDYFDIDTSVSAPAAEPLGFDNLQIWTLGVPVDPVTRPTFTANAVLFKRQIHTASLDAFVNPRTFTVDAWVVGGRLRHDRTLDHFGTQVDTTIVLTSPIGRYAAGTDLHTVLLDMVSRITALESGNHVVGTFAMSAFIRPSLRIDAVIKKTTSVAVLFDATIVGGKSTSFTAAAWLILVVPVAFTADAWLIDSPNGTWENNTPTPPADGTTTIFTVPPYAPGTTSVTVAGVPQVPGVDYVELDPGSGTIQFTTPPGSSLAISVHARYCV